MNHVVNKVNHRVRTCATSYALCTLDVINYDARTRSGSFRVVSNIPTRVRHARTHLNMRLTCVEKPDTRSTLSDTLRLTCLEIVRSMVASRAGLQVRR